MTVFESSSSSNLSSSRADLGLDVTDVEPEPERLRYAERGRVGFGGSYASYRSLLVDVGGELGGVVAKGGGDDLSLCDGARLPSNAITKSGSWHSLV